MFLDKTLEELDGQDWGEPTFQSGLVINCHRLRRVPLKDWAADDLGRFIGQKFSLDYLVPLAMMKLISDPFTGDLYTGDVLHRLLSLPSDFWHGHPDLLQSLEVVIVKALKLIEGQDELAFGVDREIVNQLQTYRFIRKP